MWAVGLFALFFLFVVFNVAGGHPVHTQQLSVPANAASGTPEAAAFTAPFVVSQAGNLEVKIEAPVSNTWMFFDGALINEDDGGLDEFDAEVGYYYGSDSDGSWSEGGTTSRQYVAAVTPGRYVLRLEPQWEVGKQPTTYTVTLRGRVTRFYWFFLTGILLSLWPLMVAWRHLRFEASRWSESDHSWTSSSSSDDSEDDE
jgi:hypothetical protein